MSPTRIGFDGTSALGEEPSVEVKGFGSMEGDEEVEIDLDDESESL